MGNTGAALHHTFRRGYGQFRKTNGEAGSCKVTQGCVYLLHGIHLLLELLRTTGSLVKRKGLQ